jgi:hypothetical protein
LEKKVDREHRDAIQLQKQLDDSVTPLLLAQVEIDNLKKELLSANRLEGTLAKKADKVLKQCLCTNIHI